MPRTLLRAAATLFLLFAWGLGGTGPAPAEAQIGRGAAARVDSVFSDLNRTDGPGCALGVVRDGRLAYAEGYGIADLDHGAPIGPESVFYMGSVSKHFVAAAVVLASRNTELSLDDPVRRWLPDLPHYDGPTVTVRHLIHHTSGLRDYLSLVGLAGREPQDLRDTGEYLDLVYRQEGLNFLPGAEYRYSNTNYLLLSEVVRSATGSSLREFTAEHVFRPLGMRNTHFHDDHEHVVRHRAVGYARGESGFRMVHQWNWEEIGSGGLYSSVEDLARWTRNFETERVGGEGFAERMTARGRLSGGEALDYALGLQLGEYRGLRTVGHGGSFPGFRTHFLRFPGPAATVIVLCNLESADAGTRARRVADVVLAERLGPEAEPEVAAGDAARRARETALYEGLYRSEDAGYLEFTAEDGELGLVSGADEQRVPLRRLGPDRFAASGPGVVFSFRGGEDGPPTGVTVLGDGDTTDVYRRVERAEYTREELAELAGAYYSPELDARYRVLTEGGEPRLVRGPREPEPLLPGKEGEFRFGAGVLRVIRGEGGGVRALVAGNSRARGIRFEPRP